MKPTLMFFPVLVLALAGCAEQPLTAPDEAEVLVAAKGSEATVATRLYEVTIENLASGQPLSPGVVVTHQRQANVFRVGQAASEGIRLIAENGDPATAVADLSASPFVHQALATTAPVLAGGDPLTIQIEAAGRARYLSLSVMLICTNDGFTGLDTILLPEEEAVYEVDGYDAGTELNDELSTTVVDACGALGPVPLPEDGNERVATDGVIAHHDGIRGGAALDPALHGWRDPVARITIRRVVAE